MWSAGNGGRRAAMGGFWGVGRRHCRAEPRTDSERSHGRGSDLELVTTEWGGPLFRSRFSTKIQRYIWSLRERLRAVCVSHLPWGLRSSGLILPCSSSHLEQSEPKERHRSTPISPRNRDFLFRASADRLKEARNQRVPGDASGGSQSNRWASLRDHRVVGT